MDRYWRFSKAMLAADFSIRLFACGGLHLGVDHEWNRRLLEEVGSAAPCHTHHILEGGTVDDSVDPKELFHAFMGHPIKVGQDYQLMRQRMLDAGIDEPRLAITELQLFAQYRGERDHLSGLGSPMPESDTISEALYFSLFAHECIRLGDLVEMITHSSTVNHSGGLRKVRERVWASPVNHAHVMGVKLADWAARLSANGPKEERKQAYFR